MYNLFFLVFQVQTSMKLDILTKNIVCTQVHKSFRQYAPTYKLFLLHSPSRILDYFQADLKCRFFPADDES